MTVEKRSAKWHAVSRNHEFTVYMQGTSTDPPRGVMQSATRRPPPLSGSPRRVLHASLARASPSTQGLTQHPFGKKRARESSLGLLNDPGDVFLEIPYPRQGGAQKAVVAAGEFPIYPSKPSTAFDAHSSWNPSFASHPGPSHDRLSSVLNVSKYRWCGSDSYSGKSRGHDVSGLIFKIE